jgi:hypothetical protein
MAIEHFGCADAEITSYHQPNAGDLEPVALFYNRASGSFERAKPTVGTRPSAGGTLAGIRERCISATSPGVSPRQSGSD